MSFHHKKALDSLGFENLLCFKFENLIACDTLMDEPEEGESKARTSTHWTFSACGNGRVDMAKGWVSCILQYIYMYIMHIVVSAIFSKLQQLFLVGQPSLLLVDMVPHYRRHLASAVGLLEEHAK